MFISGCRLGDARFIAALLCRGAEHTTIVLRDGYEFEGRKYKSLSAIARDITGTRWNGYRFFGLREAPRHNQ
jgi:hypothetical protein